jgi:AraC-like DNA-binding protein
LGPNRIVNSDGRLRQVTIHDLLAIILESAISAELFLFAAFLLTTHKSAPAHYLLAALSAVMALMLVGNLVIGTAHWRAIGDLVLALDLSAPPLVYLYVRQIRQGADPIRPAHLVHALPGVFGIGAWKLGFLSTMDIYVIACWALYIAAAAYFLVRDHACYEPAKLKRFVVGLLIVLAVIWALRVVMALQATQGKLFLDGLPYILVLSAIFIVTCGLLLISLRYPNLLSIPGSHVKYANTRLPTTGADEIQRAFDTMMRESKPYLDPDLTLAELAQRLGVLPRNVSQLVNGRFGINVSSYLNQLRVEEAARLLEELPDKPIKAVMFESGFKSKSVFNREFQRRKCASPTDFRIARKGSSVGP